MQKIASITGGFFLGIIILWPLFLGLGRKRSTEAIEHQLYRRFCTLLGKHGAQRDPSQTPREFGKVTSALLPKASTDIYAFSNLYSDLCYNPDAQSTQQENISILRKLLKKIKVTI